MLKSDDLKNRLDELFSTTAEVETLEKVFPPIGLSVAEKEAVQPDYQVVTAGLFQTVFDHAAIGMVLTDTEGRFLRANKAFGDMIGYDITELEGMDFQALTHPEDRKSGSEAIHLMLMGKSNSAKFQKRVTHKDGDLIGVELNATSIKDQGEKMRCIAYTVQDNSSQQHTAMLLEKRVRELNCLNEIGHKMDEKPPLPEFLEWVAQRIPAAFQYPEDCRIAIEYDGEIYGSPEARELPSKTVGGIRQGEEIIGWLHVAYIQQHDFIDAESALIGGIVSRLSSYLQSTQQYAETQASEKLVRTIMDATPDWIFIKDRDHRFVMSNESYAKALHRTPEQVIGKNEIELGFSEEIVKGSPKKGVRGFWSDDNQVMESGETMIIPVESAVVDNETRFLSTIKVPLHDEKGEVWGILGFVRDITERERLIEQIQARVQRERTMREIATHVRSPMDLDTVMRIAVRELGEALGRKTFVRLGSIEQLSQAPQNGSDEGTGSNNINISRTPTEGDR